MVAKKRTVKNDPNKEIVVITQKGCPACEALKSQVHNVRYMDLADSPEAVRIADTLKIDAVPTAVRIDRKTGKICKLDGRLRPVKCFVPKAGH